MESASLRIEAVPWLPLCIRQLGLQGLACLASCSKQLRRDCGELMKTDAPVALLGTLEAAGTARAAAALSAVSSTMEEEAINGVINALAWLRQQVPKEQEAELAAMAAGHVVRFPEVPLWQALQFCNAGVRVNNAQLLDAADSMVPGVEIWVQAQRQLEIKTGISPAAVAICCNNCSASWNLGLFRLQDLLKEAAAEDLPGLLQLAMNCKRPSGSFDEKPATAVAAVNSLPAALEPAVARRLLLTAAARHGAGISSYLAARDSIREHIDAPTLEAVITQLLAAKTCSCTAAAAKSDWYQLPAAVGLNSAAVARLLQAVVNQPPYLMPCGCPQCVQQLCSLPAANELSCSSLESLLKDACQRGTFDCVEPLFGLPAAQEIGDSVVAQLLFAAVQRGSCHKLRDLPGVELLSSDTVVQLLRSALQQKYTEDALTDIEYLRGLPAAKRVSSSDMAHLVELASERGHAQCVALLQAVQCAAE